MRLAASVVLALATATLTTAGAGAGRSHSAAPAGPGNLDPSFGNGGKVLTIFDRSHFPRLESEGINAVAIQSNGKVVVASSSLFITYTDRRGHGTSYRNPQLARYNANGSLDTNFGSGGKTRAVSSSTDLQANAVAIQSNGKIVVAGNNNGSLRRDGFLLHPRLSFALVRYNANGSVDTHFGSSSQVLTDFGVGRGSIGSALVIQHDGKIVVAGTSTKKTANGRSSFALARYNANGSLDTRFGSKGKVLTDFASGSASGVAATIQPDGKIVVAGTVNEDWDHRYGEPLKGFYVALARYNIDGSLDAGFGSAGRAQAGFSTSSSDVVTTSVALQSDGKIVVAGIFNGGGQSPDFGLSRFNKDGSLDTGFTGNNQYVGGVQMAGIAGFVRTDWTWQAPCIPLGGCESHTYDYINGIVIQADGKIVAAGTSFFGNNFALARYNPDGSLDTGFGDSGYVFTLFSPLTLHAEATAVALQSDGRIVVVGNFHNSGGKIEFALARYFAS